MHGSEYSEKLQKKNNMSTNDVCFISRLMYQYRGSTMLCLFERNWCNQNLAGPPIDELYTRAELERERTLMNSDVDLLSFQSIKDSFTFHFKWMLRN